MIKTHSWHATAELDSCAEGMAARREHPEQHVCVPQGAAFQSPVSPTGNPIAVTLTSLHGLLL